MRLTHIHVVQISAQRPLDSHIYTAPPLAPWTFSFPIKYLSDNFRKNIYCNFECEHDIGKKWWVFKKQFIWKKLFKNFYNSFHPLLMSGMGSQIVYRTSLVPSITYILSIQIDRAVFEKIWFFDFSKFVYKFCKKFFLELIIGVNLSCSGSQLPLQYGSNPSGGTQTMLILLRPL